MAKVRNKTMNKAIKNRNDEFYTQLNDISNELQHYREHFAGKTVLCNCDDPAVSNFFNYFSLQFEFLGLKKLITTCYKNNQVLEFTSKKVEKAIYLEYYGDKNGNKRPDMSEIQVKPLHGDGDFRSPECIKFLEEADIVVTNPPFSLFREYVAQLMEYKKKFLIIGTLNAVTYKEIFPLIKNNEIWFGNNTSSGILEFQIPEHIADMDRISGIRNDENGNKLYFTKVMGIRWFTNLPHKKRNEEIILCRKYHGNEKDYPKYDDYDAIEVSKVANIPMDYDGIMGVPISFLDRYNPNQFEILGLDDHRKWRGIGPILNGKGIYRRIIIRRRKENLTE
jgi:hypothetical protein